ncbi:unnamed protein product [Clonostachys rosea]|uniref:F-box domain-containing protein n=1 Tax=Bionectria ochroleuca TaxID=29856 RepID=A0ABY6TW73_BIOOC|nr:unnamed protein product [Clonostachys rosea]
MSPRLSDSCYVAWRVTGWPGQANPPADTTVQGLEPYYLADSVEGSIVFVFHEFCWQMLLIQLAHDTDSDPDHDDVAYWIFFILSCIPRWNRRLLPRHGYHGVMAIRESSHLRGVLEATIDHTPFPSVPAGHHSSQERTGSAAPLPTLNLPSYDPFRKLPPEIIWEFILYLPYDDIHNARLSSRHFAMHTSTKRLPQKFWASRFSLDMDMGFVLAMDNNETGYADMDWRTLFDNCMRLLRQPGSMGDGFRNRQRVWICLRDIAVTLANLLPYNNMNPIIFGVPAMSLFGYHLGQRISCLDLESRDRGDTSQAMESKISRTREILFRQRPNSIISSIEYSTLIFESAPYICGLRVSWPPEDEFDNEPFQEVGLLLPSRTKSVPVEKDISLSDISVCYSPDGVHGFSIFTHEADGRLEKLSIGRTDIIYPNTTTTMLQSSGSGPIVGLLFGFDVWLSSIYSWTL